MDYTFIPKPSYAPFVTYVLPRHAVIAWFTTQVSTKVKVARMFQTFGLHNTGTAAEWTEARYIEISDAHYL